jgi:NAD(P)-dependent dehydrogenase (short-subunit alcohol dehydrogenase family)
MKNRIDRGPAVHELHGKAAFISGGASGIGLGIAKALLGADMRVVIADIRRENLDRAGEELRLHGERVHLLQLDVTDRESMSTAAIHVESKLGNLHVLCANAGVGDIGRLKDASYEDWDWITGVTLGGVINCVATFLPRMLAHGEAGHIVATSSMAGLLPVNHGGIYCVAKTSVVGMMEALRMELADTPIGVSVLCPGMTQTNIRTTLALRPAKYRRPERAAAPPPSANAAGSPPSGSPPDFMKHAMDPSEIGAKVLRGIRRNDLYILTHAEFGAMLRSHFDEILAAMPPADPALRAAGSMMSTPYSTALGHD